MALEVPPFRVVGTVFLYPGSEPDRLLDRATEMFVPVVDAVAYRRRAGDRRADVDAVLVNRFYLRGVEQVDKRTGERPRSCRARHSAGSAGRTVALGGSHRRRAPRDQARAGFLRRLKIRNAALAAGAARSASPAGGRRGRRSPR